MQINGESIPTSVKDFLLSYQLLSCYLSTVQSQTALSMVHQTVRTANTLLRESRRLFRPAGLSDAQFNVLNILAQKEGDLSQSELSEILVVDRSNITGLLDRMEKSGWVMRQVASGDRRKYHVQLTAEGRKLWRRIYPKYEEAVVTAVRTVGIENAKRTIDTLARLEQAAKAINQTA